MRLNDKGRSYINSVVNFILGAVIRSMMTTINNHQRLSPQSGMSPDLISNPQLSTDKFKIVHAISGRVRIRATDASVYSQLNIISHYLQQENGVKKVAINQQTGSLIVTFAENQLSLSQVMQLLQKLGISQPETSPLITPLTEWKSQDFWQEQSMTLIPLITGLLVTGALGISGLAGICAYMIAVDVTSRLIKNFQPQIGEKSTTSKRR
jgi:hypothetical protein